MAENASSLTLGIECNDSWFLVYPRMLPSSFIPSFVFDETREKEKNTKKKVYRRKLILSMYVRV